MAGVDSILRVIGATLSLVVIAWVTSIAYKLIDPIYMNVIDTQLMQKLGWGTPQNVVMFFMGLAFIGLTMVVIIWMLVAPVKNDVRQSTAGGGRGGMPPF